MNVVDDIQLFIEGIKAMLFTSECGELVEEHYDGERLVNSVKLALADLVLIDKYANAKRN